MNKKEILTEKDLKNNRICCARIQSKQTKQFLVGIPISIIFYRYKIIDVKLVKIIVGKIVFLKI